MPQWTLEQHLACYYVDRFGTSHLDRPLAEVAATLGVGSIESFEMRVRNYKWVRTAGERGLKGSGYTGVQQLIHDQFVDWPEERLRALLQRVLEGSSLSAEGVSFQTKKATETRLAYNDVVRVLEEVGELSPLEAEGSFKLLRHGKEVALTLVRARYLPGTDRYVWTFELREDSLNYVLCYHDLLPGLFVFQREMALHHSTPADGKRRRLSISGDVSGVFQFTEHQPPFPVPDGSLVFWDDLAPDLSLSLFPPTLRPRARLMSILGQQLIRDNTVGLLELVKNAYDADADTVSVMLRYLHDLDRTTIVVHDDGDGMTKETVLGPFLEPAAGHKEMQKRAQMRTRKGRLPLGEKGVGRFAAHRLGRRLNLVTRARDADREVVVEIDWNQFERHDSYLSDIPIVVYERAPRHFPGDKHGTRLEMVGAREPWTKVQVQELQKHLQRMMSPFEAAKDFKVSLQCPEYPEYEDLTPTDLLERSHFVLTAEVSGTGEAAFEYRYAIPGLGERTESGVSDLRLPIVDWVPPSRRSACGPFKLHLYAWERSADMLKRSQVSRRELNQLCGVSVFRDGIRILPYGEPGDDWLALDRRRIDAPVDRIGNKNIIGYVEINQTDNALLVDKTNREGLIENNAFIDFKALVSQSVSLLENLRLKDREKEQKQRTGQVPKSLDTIVTDLQSAADGIDAVHEKVAKRVEALRPILEDSVDGRALMKLVKSMPAQVSNVRIKSGDLVEVVTGLEQNYEAQRDLLVSLAGFGLAAERFTHEFARLTKEADDALRTLLSANPDLQKASYLKALQAALDGLKNDIRNMEPLLYVRRGAAVKQIDIKDAIDTAFRLHRGDIRNFRIHVQVRGISFLVKMREGPCIQVFNNLIDNSVFWVMRTESQRDIVVDIDPDQRRVTFGDSGPGIDPSVVPHLFQPFITTKHEGRGLGLYISREILEEARGTIRVARDDERIPQLPGATFVLEFPELGGDIQ